MMSVCSYCQNKAYSSGSSTVDEEADESTLSRDFDDNKLNSKFLPCSSCQATIHIGCLKSQPISLLINDYLFDLTCKECSDFQEVFTRPPKIPSIYLTILVLYNLHRRQTTENGFYHLKNEIVSFAKTHAPDLLRSRSAQNTISSTLSTYNTSVFESGQPYKLTGYWRLLHVRAPLLTDKYMTRAENSKKDEETVIQHGKRARKRKSIDPGFLTDPVRRTKRLSAATTTQSALPTITSDPLADNSVTYDDVEIDVTGDLDLPDPSQSLLSSVDLDMKELDELAVAHIKQEPKDILIGDEENSQSAEYLDRSQLADAPTESSQTPTISRPNSSNEDPILPSSHRTSPVLIKSEQEEQHEAEEIEDRETRKYQRSTPVVQPEVPESRRMTVYEEEKILKRLQNFQENTTLPTHLNVVYRKLYVRKLKRDVGLPMFDILQYRSDEVQSDIFRHINTIKTEGSATLDRYQRPVLKVSSYHTQVTKYTIPIVKNINLQLVTSPFTNRILKPFIWRDFECNQPKLKLLEEIRYKYQSNSELEPSSIDYCYVRAEHIPAINHICRSAFWPTIDLSESLQYPDFSCVVLYKNLIIAFSFMVPDVNYHEAYISFIYTHPEWRGAGIASFMLYHLIQGTNSWVYYQNAWIDFCSLADKLPTVHLIQLPIRFQTTSMLRICLLAALVVMVSGARPPLCDLPMVVGPCDGRIPSFHFDPEVGYCRSFNYGGCSGNRNRFRTNEDCQRTCVFDAPAITTNEERQRDDCRLPIRAGFCDKYKSVFGYNARFKACFSFLYGGCLGNANRFNTLEECKQKCVNPPTTPARITEPGVTTDGTNRVSRNIPRQCNQPIKVGFCKGQIKAFAFDGQKCTMFYYGGCMGNQNRFNTLASCERVCMRPITTPVQAASTTTTKTTHAKTTPSKITATTVQTNATNPASTTASTPAETIKTTPVKSSSTTPVKATATTPVAATATKSNKPTGTPTTPAVAVNVLP